MRAIDLIFLRVATLYLMVGLISDLVLAGTQFDLLAGAHAHLYMIGFGLHALFGLVYHHWSELKGTRLARIHSSLFLFGAPLLIIGSASPHPNEMNNAILFGSLFVLLGCLAFTLSVFRLRSHASGKSNQ